MGDELNGRIDQLNLEKQTLTADDPTSVITHLTVHLKLANEIFTELESCRTTKTNEVSVIRAELERANETLRLNIAAAVEATTNFETAKLAAAEDVNRSTSEAVAKASAAKLEADERVAAAQATAADAKEASEAEIARLTDLYEVKQRQAAEANAAAAKNKNEDHAAALKAAADAAEAAAVTAAATLLASEAKVVSSNAESDKLKRAFADLTNKLKTELTTIIPAPKDSVNVSDAGAEDVGYVGLTGAEGGAEGGGRRSRVRRLKKKWQSRKRNKINL